MTRRRVLLGVLTAALLALPAVAGCTSGRGGSVSTKPSQLNDQNGGGLYEGFGLSPAQPRPAFTLTDTTGRPFSFGTATAGRPTFLYFGYTHCPDVCPTTMADIGLAMKAVPATVRQQTLVVFVSTDVTNDTEPVIAAWLKSFDSGLPNVFVGLTGTQAQIDAAQAAAHVALATDEGQTHSAQVLLYGADDYARVSYVQSDTEMDAMAHDLPLVAKK
jgi:protein SCO1/2